MVLSGTKKTSSISSIVNQNQGGGMKKAGMPPTETVSVAQRMSYNSAASVLNLTAMQKPVSVTRRSQHFVGMRFTS